MANGVFCFQRGICLHISDSVEHSGGQRVRLELQNLNQFSIFPGQVCNMIYNDHISESLSNFYIATC